MARVEAENARKLSEQKFEEAEAYLLELQEKKGAGQGLLWWMTRELAEAKRFMTQRQMEVAQRKHDKMAAELEDTL